jgi:predicted dehydrogenase
VAASIISSVLKKLSIGVLGCGNIARDAYFPSFTSHYASLVRLAACADVVPAAAQRCAAAFSIPRVLTPDELLADPEIDLVVNLTIPEAHYELNKRALEAGKHVYSEKPLALSTAEALELGRIAEARGLMLAVAPDTILGAPHQAARRALDAGAIGTVRHVSAWCSLSLPFKNYYRPAAGPILDFGPYYVGLLVFLLGPVARVAAFGAAAPITPQDGGPDFLPAVPAHAAVALQFVSGVTGTLGLATDACLYESGVELLGTAGRLSVPDPNKFESAARIKTNQEDAALPPGSALLDGERRGAGVADMARALAEGRPHRLANAFGVHCTEVLVSILESIRTGRAVDLTTTCVRPEPMAPPSSADPFAFVATS